MDERAELRVGVARCDITPPIGIAHGNWSPQVHERAEGVDLPLWCTVLAAADGHEEILIGEGVAGFSIGREFYGDLAPYCACVHRRSLACEHSQTTRHYLCAP